MSQEINISNSVTLHPSNYSSTNSSYSTTSSQYPISNGYTDSSDTSYAYITCKTGSQASSYISYTFDVSSIPNSATISSISCTAKVRVSSTSYISTATLQLYNGSNAKGSSTSARNTTNGGYTYTLTPGSWTRSELDNIQIRYTATRGTSNTNRAAYIYFYGASLTINYTISGTQYTIVASSNVSGYTPTPDTQNVMGGETAYIDIYTDSLSDVSITDNDIDVTSSFTEEIINEAQTISAVPESSFETGFSESGANFYQNSTTTSTAWLEYAIGHSAESPYSTSNTSNTYVKDSTGSSNSTATGWFGYSFDFSSIPENSTITSITVKCYGARENSSTGSQYVARIGLYCNGTLKGAEQEFTSTSNGSITLSNTGTWSRAELQHAQLRFTVGYYGGRMLGITWTVNYTPPIITYWRYTLNNVSADHVIIVDRAGAFEPPEEDPQYTYHSLTISSINATTDPEGGTTRVIEGSNQTIIISPADPQLTLALDNGVDITSQLNGNVPSNTYTVTGTVSGASYGFTLNNNTGYYVSNNAGKSNSAAVCRVNFTCESDCLVTIQYINYAEATYDYGIFGKVDTALGTTYTADSNTQLSCSTNALNSASAQTLTYNLTSGSHYIDIKFRKDTNTDNNNDSLQWKILSIEATGNSGDYTYTLTNITERHSLIFVFGDVDYYIITSNGSNCRLFPDGQQVKLAGQSYSLTIVPDDISMDVTLTDNGVNQTTNLEYVEGTNKDNETIVNYLYHLTNLAANHTLSITCLVSGGTAIYLKINGEWTPCSKVYQKINGSWVQVQDPSSLFSTTANYVKNN